MPWRFPLFARILCWFLLNLALLAGVGWLVIEQQTRFGFDSLLAGRAGDRIRLVADLVIRELNENPQEQWNAVLARFSATYPLEFHLLGREGNVVAGPPVVIPPEVAARLSQMRGPPPQPPRFWPAGSQPGRGPDGPDASARWASRGISQGPAASSPRTRVRASFRGALDGATNRCPIPPSAVPRLPGFVRAGNPKRYWVLVHAPVGHRMPGGPITLAMVSSNLSAGGLILDYVPFLWAGAIALALSVLFWLPLIRSITRSIGAMRDATVCIADGRFEIRVDARRRDELGALGLAINHMSERLAGLMNGQRRFLSDVAHELCAPLSRLQMALGILESRAPEGDRERLLDVREEVDHVAGLVNELLSFSRAALNSGKIQLAPVAIRPLLEKVAHRESVEGVKLDLECPDDLQAQGDSDLLERALGNLLRNAIRYAGQAGPITVRGAERENEVQIEVADRGPGVPEAVLPELFDPFFRVDTSRTRETGGVGLGLTIARTCIEACNGTIAARNLTPSGLFVKISLPGVVEAPASRAD